MEIRREVVPCPGAPLVLLILESKVSAGWEMTAAAIPAMRPAVRLRLVLCAPVSESLDLLVAERMFSTATSKLRTLERYR